MTYIIGELKTQIEFAKLSFHNFRQAYDNTIIPNTFMYIHHFLIHISNIDKILDVRNNPFRKKILGEHIPKFNLKEFRRVRNHLEHFDERLDEWIKN